MDRALSNDFFAEVVKFYHLDRWVQDKPRTDKEYANIFEVWVYAYTIEAQMYPRVTELLVLEDFFRRLWHLQFGELKIYSYNPLLTRRQGFVREDWDIKIDRVQVPGEPLLEKLLGGGPSAVQQGVQTLGYAAVIRSKGSKRSLLSAFAPSRNALDDRIMESIAKAGGINVMMRINNLDCPQTSSPPPTSSPGSEYRTRYCQAVRDKFPAGMDSLREDLREWLNELQNSRDARSMQFKVMLKWQLVSPP